MVFVMIRTLKQGPDIVHSEIAVAAFKQSLVRVLEL